METPADAADEHVVPTAGRGEREKAWTRYLEAVVSKAWAETARAWTSVGLTVAIPAFAMAYLVLAHPQIEVQRNRVTVPGALVTAGVAALVGLLRWRKRGGGW